MTGRGLRRWWPVAAASAGLLAWGNVVVPSVASGALPRTATNVGATIALVATVRACGVTLRELGLGRGTWRAGASWGGAAFGAAAVGYLVALAVPAGRAALAGGPGAGMTAGELAVRAVVLIPLGTVLVEETAFRGVLLALARRRFGDRCAAAVTAAVFGLWHVSSAVRAGDPVPGTVVVTTLGGLLFAWLRLRSGSLLAPAGLHLGTNGLGLLATAAAAR